MECYKDLGIAVIRQAVIDYFKADERGREFILKDLRSEWCDFISNGLSRVVAEKLKKNPSIIKERLKKMERRVNCDAQMLIHNRRI